MKMEATSALSMKTGDIRSVCWLILGELLLTICIAFAIICYFHLMCLRGISDGQVSKEM